MVSSLNLESHCVEQTTRRNVLLSAMDHVCYGLLSLGSALTRKISAVLSQEKISSAVLSQENSALGSALTRNLGSTLTRKNLLGSTLKIHLLALTSTNHHFTVLRLHGT